MADVTVGTAYAVVVTAVPDPTQVDGLEWDRAVEYLPSIASPALHTWVLAQEGATRRRGVVIPGPRRRVAPRHPYREVCVPAAEFHLFSAAIRTHPRCPAAETIRPEEDPRRRAPLVTARATRLYRPAEPPLIVSEPPGGIWPAMSPSLHDVPR
ncbi:hypothetical protein H0264_14115 [Nocardia huaxiensis]|uniref:Uncharacterized protein n=1 Tax=Nocardia huaxiensis TaxID=2755382 RepID=A0A7D6ZDW3_9NOCA|nr:hypothetical protein [Nocardia huaxiensis]QLY33208.1 hypothetical protein H0264_14115 [Nocardia huaxiensis]